MSCARICVVGKIRQEKRLCEQLSVRLIELCWIISFSQVFRQTFARSLLLVVSLGYGIVRPKLMSAEWIAVVIVSVLYFIGGKGGLLCIHPHLFLQFCGIAYICVILSQRIFYQSSQVVHVIFSSICSDLTLHPSLFALLFTHSYCRPGVPDSASQWYTRRQSREVSGSQVKSVDQSKSHVDLCVYMCMHMLLDVMGALYLSMSLVNVTIDLDVR